MTLTARQLRQPPTIEAIERVPYFADVIYTFYCVLISISSWFTFYLLFIYYSIFSFFY